MKRIDQVKELFQLALDKDEAAREAFVARLAGGDTRLRDEVMALLKVHEEAEKREPPAAEPGESAGDKLGPYKLLQPIGTGGFGVVWMAEQERPVRRKVALKIIKLGMDTKQVVARFEAERQALAMMDHENIAKVFDAGATERGRPYFVMELVKGVPITEYCDQAQLSTHDRLELFQDVCHAVQHAHHKGVIHRDLKPSNVLVTLHDGRPVPKVIDFGVAKATDHRLTERTLFTEFRQIVGTPEYMSPEQAEFSSLDIDTRSDIYSLGVLLYELLTGTKPFDMRELLERGFDEMLRHIREVDPPKPSTRISTLGEAGTGIAQHRRTAPRMLGRLLRGDLDWICMKALEKERGRRYGTASDFAADIDRYLLDLPIEARPPSAGYRAAKFARRHRKGVAAAAVAALALVAGLVVAALGWREAEAQRGVAAAREREARTEAVRARTVIALLQGMLGAGDPHAAKGAAYTVRELLDEFSGGLRGQLDDEPEVAATLHQILANAYAHLELLDKAEHHQEIALDLRRRHLGEMHPDTIESLTAHAWRIHDRANYAEAERLLRDLRTRVADAPLEDPTPDLLDYALGDMLCHLARYDEAEKSAKACVERLRARKAPADEVAIGLRLLSRVASGRGDAAGAEALCREALKLERDALGPDHTDVALTLQDLAQMRMQHLAYEEAVQLFRESNAIWRKQLGRDSPVALSGLGAALDKLGRCDEAEQAKVRAVELSRELKGDTHPDTADALLSLGALRINLCAYAAAEKCFREALAIERAAFQPGHPAIAKALERLAESLDRQHRPAEMEPLLEEALEIRRRASREESLSEAYGLLGVARAGQGRFEEGERLAREGVEKARSLLKEHEQTTRCLEYLRRVLVAKGAHEEAAAVAREILDFWRKHVGEKSLLTALSWNNLGCQLQDVHDDKGAEEAYRRSLAIWDEIRPEHPEKTAPLNNLGLMLEDRGDLEEAERMFREALRIGEASRHADDVARYRYHLGLVLQARGKGADAEAEFRAALTLLREHVGDGSPRTVEAWGSLGGILLDTRPADAAQVFDEAVRATRAALGPEDDRTLTLARRLAFALSRCGRSEDGERILRETLATVVRVHGRDADDAQACSADLACFLATEGRGAEAEPLLREAVAHFRKPDAPLDAFDFPLLTLVQCLQQEGKYDEAEPFCRDLLGARRKQLGEGDPDLVQAIELLATSLSEQDKGAATEPVAKELVDARRKGTDRAQLAYALMLLGKSLSAQKKYPEAEPALAECLEIRREVLPKDSWLIPNTMSILGGCLAGLGKFADAEPLLVQGYEAMSPPPPWAFRRREARDRVVALYEAWGKQDKADLWRAKPAE